MSVANSNLKIEKLTRKSMWVTNLIIAIVSKITEFMCLSLCSSVLKSFMQKISSAKSTIQINTLQIRLEFTFTEILSFVQLSGNRDSLLFVVENIMSNTFVSKSVNMMAFVSVSNKILRRRISNKCYT